MPYSVRRTLLPLLPLLPLILWSAAACPVGAYAADYAPEAFGGLHWRSIGPFRGGRVLAVTGVPGQPLHWYFGAVDGGVWETRDAGRTWRPIFDGEPVASVGAIAVAPSNPNVHLRRHRRGGHAVGHRAGRRRLPVGRRRQDLGRHRTRGLRGRSRRSSSIRATRTSPTSRRSAILTGRTRSAACSRRSTAARPGARCCTATPTPAPSASLSSRAIPRSSTRRCGRLAGRRGTSIRRRTGPAAASTSPTDGGEHWLRVEGNGFPAQVGRIGIALSPAAPQRVYAIVDAAEGGLYRSDDGGAHWQRASADPRIWQRGWYFDRHHGGPDGCRSRLGDEHDRAALGGRRQELSAGEGRPDGR